MSRYLLAFDFTIGDANNALNEPNTIVLSKPLAEKLFGGQNPLYQTINLSDPYGSYDFKVTGVLDPATHKSHIDGNFYMNMQSTASGQRFYDLQEWAGKA